MAYANYKIKSIRHSGTKGTRGWERTDARYPMRVGRVVSLDLNSLSVGNQLILNYVKDENGNDYRGYMLMCSVIRGIHAVSERLFCIETYNSIYEFESEE